MKVLLSTFSWRTHLYNFVPLAWAFAAAGHEVRVAAEPALTDDITGAGLTAVVVGAGSEPLPHRLRSRWQDGSLPTPASAPPLGQPRELFDLALDRKPLSWKEINRLHDELIVPRAALSNDVIMDDLVAHCLEWQPDVVLWNSATFAGAVAAEACGALHGRVLYSADLYTRMRNDLHTVAAALPESRRRDPFRDWITPWTVRHGVEFSERLAHGDFTIDQLPPAFRLPTTLTTLTTQYVPYNGPAVIPDWLAEPPAAPRVLMTSGLSVNEWPELRPVGVDRLREVLTSLADLDIELVLTVPEPIRAVLEVPANTRCVEYVPMAAVLPSCSAVVHHGGTGSTSTATRSGTPQLMMSQALDAPIKGAELTRLGAGEFINPNNVTGRAVRENLLRILQQPSYRFSALRLREQLLAEPSPARTVEAVEHLHAHRSRPMRAVR